MKTSLLIMVGLILSNSALAQTQKGNGLLSGSIAVNYSRQESSSPGPTTWTPAISLTVGRFWTDNWLAGLSVSGASTLTRQQLSQNSAQTYPSTMLSIGVTPFVRRYWQFNSVYLFAGAGISVNSIYQKQSFFDSNGQEVDNGQTFSSVNVSPRLEVGANYFLTNRLGLQVVASANSLPLNTAGLSAGLVYWTGPDRRANSPEERSNAQTNRGRWVIEGDFSGNKQKNSQAENPSGIVYQSSLGNYSFSPSVSYFFKKNNLIGISIPVSYSADKTTTSGVSPIDNSLWGMGISPYFQHYWTSTRLTPYTRVNAGYMRYTSDSFKGNNISGGITIGLAYMAGNRFIIETSLANASANYLVSDRLSGVSTNKIWTAGISVGLAGNFAIRYVL